MQSYPQRGWGTEVKQDLLAPKGGELGTIAVVDGHAQHTSSGFASTIMHCASPAVRSARFMAWRAVRLWPRRTALDPDHRMRVQTRPACTSLHWHRGIRRRMRFLALCSVLLCLAIPAAS